MAAATGGAWDKQARPHRHPSRRDSDRPTILACSLYRKMTQRKTQQEEEGETALAEPNKEEEIDLTPMLRAALDKLWQRPYDCRIFTLQLLQGLAQLDDSSLFMMTSCFARYLENHSVPA